MILRTVILSLTVCASIFAAAPATAEKSEAVARIPVLTGESYRVCTSPDLGELSGPIERKEHIVDHGFLQAEDGTWTLWACMRGTKVSRLLYGWRGESLTAENWQPLGVVARAEIEWGEKKVEENGRITEQMQAPFFMQEEFRGWPYLCFYNSGGIRLMVSRDGKDFERLDLGGDRGNLLYPDGGRDVMLLKSNGTYYAYSTVSTLDRRGYVNLRTSKDLLDWTPSKMVSFGGKAGSGPVSAESPYVVELDGYFYLFRASSITFKTYVYRSDDPTDFGIDDDSKLIAEFPIKAPEVFAHEGEWYISDLADFKGIKLHGLKWPVAE
ncbi:hypothetical protein [Stratiformator vulcanicus]|uniref:Glycosyl hydrolases family 43 n=1 Tax=Stratiformator vulcanicus TaxID=2527980 RepID=A0A517QYS0_9PLAN|nr:hypothetical protein [Stratiformator vulcanicus]QDT36754.1 hypothetical protein Pan189_11170 [Stratiformator vulcanicus]